jgi:hypothetical protein
MKYSWMSGNWMDANDIPYGAEVGPKRRKRCERE